MSAELDSQGRLVIDIVVHGRFHGFALARALTAHGHDVLVHTNYPAFVAARFGVPPTQVRSLVTHGVAARAISKFMPFLTDGASEPILHRWFGRWAARSVRRNADIIYGFSGVMEELLLSPRTNAKQLRTIVRGSAHIEVQERLLLEEEIRAGSKVEKPSSWMIAREVREYALADKIFVLSKFARDSFIEADRSTDGRLVVNPLGVNVGQFKVSPEDRVERRRRILSGAPLTVLNVGTFSYQKGVLDLVEAARRMGNRARFRFVGSLPAETQALRSSAASDIEINGRVSEFDLPGIYRSADLFLFPTIQDGFAAVLLQAASAGLPVIATTNCSAPDFIEEDRTGWIVPIRDPDAIVERLTWCDTNREELADMADRVGDTVSAHDWNIMAYEIIGAYSIARSETINA